MQHSTRHLINFHFHQYMHQVGPIKFFFKKIHEYIYDYLQICCVVLKCVLQYIKTECDMLVICLFMNQQEREHWGIIHILVKFHLHVPRSSVKGTFFFRFILTYIFSLLPFNVMFSTSLDTIWTVRSRRALSIIILWC